MIKKFLFILFLCCFTHKISAQPGEQVFIDLDTGFSIIHNSFTDTWDPYPAAHVNFRVPFYSGQLEAGIRYTRFEGSAPTTTDSDFHSIFLNVGWNYPINITSRYQISPAVRFGNNLMLFDESEVFINNSGTERFITDQRESEFAYELALRSQFQLSKRWYINATLSYNRTLTFFPLPVTLFSVGISRSFQQPLWLKNFIK